jgi:fatty-acyl-CoA synthase
MIPSYTIGTSGTPLLGETIGACLDRVASAHGGRLALVSRHQGRRYSYAALRADVDRVARALLSIGVGRGERIALWSPSRAEWLLVQYAAAKIGAILVTINPAYRRAELEHVLRQSGASALFSVRRSQAHDHSALLADLLGRGAFAGGGRIASAACDRLRFLISLDAGEIDGALSWDAFIAGGDEISAQCLREQEAAVQFEHPACVLYTSGTTGRPKGATLTHHTILNCGFFMGERLRYTADDRICLPVPLYHCLGSVMGNLAALTHASAIVLPGDAFEPSTCLRAVQADACTALYGVPTMFISLLRHKAFAPDVVRSLRTGIIAGAPCPVDLMREIVSTMHMPEVTCCYGMTETPPITQSAPEDPLELRVSTVGTVHPYVECKIVDPASGAVVPRGAAGELCARGYGVMRGYWSDPAQTEQAIDAQRWIHTGDRAVMHEDGHVSIVGRLKDMIIRGGENIYPREIEEALHAHPKVLDAYVVGVPDAEYHEELCACIRLHEGMAADDVEVRAHCRERLAPYKVPRYVHFISEFPMTATGKVQKFRLRDIAIAQLGIR